MELSVKKKLVKGEILKGIIDENLNQIAPFKFPEIYEINIYGRIYYVCVRKDKICSLYDDNGMCLIKEKDGYKGLKPLKCSNLYGLSENTLKIIAIKNNEIGILYIYPKYNRDYSKLTGFGIEVEYPFGKVDDIKELEDGTVQLINHTKRNNLIGYYYHKEINEVIEPEYIEYDYFKIKCKAGVGLYENPYYRLSDHLEKDKLTTYVEMILYSKFKDGKKVKGVKQKVCEYDQTEYKNRIFLADLLSDDYSMISYDEDRQLFFLEQTINGKVKKGFVGVTFDWHFTSIINVAAGYPNLKIEVNVPCEYDDLEIIDDKYVIVKKDNKYGLMEYSFGKSSGDFLYNKKRVSVGYLREIVPCEYDLITKKGDNFIGIKNKEEIIITNCVNPNTNESIIIANSYKKTNLLYDNSGCNAYLCDLNDETENKKELVIIDKNQYDYHFPLYKINKITNCVNAEIINYKKGKLLLKVTSNDSTDIYCNSEKIIENVIDINHDNEDYYIITDISGHITCIDKEGAKVFTTTTLGIVPVDLSVTYLKAINKFKLKNNNEVRIYTDIYNKDNSIYENRVFSCFDAVNAACSITFIGYTETIENTNVTRLSRIDSKNENEIELLKGNFQVENIVLDGKRIIFSTIDNNQKKYGVIESTKGNVCIDCIYNNIEFDSRNKVFICNDSNGKIIFDKDGYINENQNLNNSFTSQVLKVSLQEN